MRMKSLVAVIAAALIMAGCAGSSGDAAPSADGITVHGDWTVDIYNSDGSFDRSVDFNNEVVVSGLDVLARGLVSSLEIGDWTIALDSDAGDANGPCIDAGGPAPCEATATTSSGYGSDNATVRLEASMTADRDGEIGLATSFVDWCYSSDSSCPATMYTNTFSEKSIRDSGGAQYQVSAGQQIQIDVVFTFTSG